MRGADQTMLRVDERKELMVMILLDVGGYNLKLFVG
jgi:hypothetical protein